MAWRTVTATGSACRVAFAAIGWRASFAHRESRQETPLSPHILESCPALRPVLESASLAGPWLSAGPIRPGIRHCYADGVFVVGNAAGEAHPAVAEGISMAMQSAWLLVDRLIASKDEQSAAREYNRDWRRSFAPRIRAAAAIAHWTMRPRLVAATLPLFQASPKLLTFGAWLSGKSKLVVQPT